MTIAAQMANTRESVTRIGCFMRSTLPRDMLRRMSDQPSTPPDAPPKKRESFNPRGRKPKLTPEIKRKICEVIALGTMCEASAARAAGISSRTLFRWIERGRLAIRTKATEQRAKKYAALCHAMDRAREDGRKALEAYVAKGVASDPRIALEVLSRKYPADWGRKLSLSGEVDHKHEHVVLSPQDAREALMRKLGVVAPAPAIAEVRVIAEKVS